MTPRKLSALAIVLLGLAGCSKPRACTPGTVLVSFSLAGAAGAATSIEITVALGLSQKISSLPLRAGTSSGSVEIDFPAGYPQNQPITVSISAEAAGAVLASGAATAVLGAACANLEIALGVAADGGASDADLGLQLFALEPTVAQSNASLSLEGNFDPASPTTVIFPGGAKVPAAVLGAHRASVIVPIQASAGPLQLVSARGASNTLSFRRATFTLGLNPFRDEYEQTSHARAMPALTTPRSDFGTIAVGDLVYLIGGQGASGAVGSIEQATLNADGTIGAFTPSALSLVTARSGQATLAIGEWVYAIGGADLNGRPLASLERALIGPKSQTLAPFTTVSGATLATARTDFATAVVGDSLYVFGGSDASGSYLASVERAPIATDGTLGPFALVPGVTLTTGRAGCAATVYGKSVYLLGGNSANGPLPTIESAPVDGDGTVGSFAPLPGVTLNTPRAAFSTAVLGSQLYVVGGKSTEDLSTIERATLSASGLSAFALGPATLATPRHGQGTLLLNNSLYVFGGIEGTNVLGSSERSSIDLDGVTGRTSTLATTLSSSRSLFSAVVLGPWLYVVGGNVGGLQVGTIERAAIASDGTVGAFAAYPTSALVTPRDGAALAVVGNDLYVVGGENGLGALASVERAPIATDGSLGMFSTLTEPLNFARAQPTCAILGGKYLNVIGGAAMSTPQAKTEYAPIAGSNLGAFSALATLNVARYGHSSLVDGDHVWVLGGSTDSATSVAVVEDGAFDPANPILGAFGAYGQSLYEPLTDFALVAVGPELYTYGGVDGATATADVATAALAADGSPSGFSLTTSQVTPTADGLIGIVLGNQLLLLGGSHLQTAPLL